MHILIVEDDPVIARGLQVFLESAHFDVSHASTLARAFELFAEEKFSLAVLDLGLTDGSGLTFLQHVRDSGSQLPIIILTAKTDEDSVVEGLQKGANDYMKKPFSNRELHARIHTVLRVPSNNDNKIVFGDLQIEKAQRLVKIKDRIIELNRREFDLLCLLAIKPDAILTRERILTVLDKEAEIFDRTIDSHISHLRSKLRQAGADGIKISSVYGVGYRLEKV
ncbi:MAG: response regulator transcription factor [Bdellovibrionaceae bacterium]|nr:response regulator transcription factor [Pseudobdellovibrionaceae bacterium]